MNRWLLSYYLALLNLGIKDIHIGPTLLAFYLLKW